MINKKLDTGYGVATIYNTSSQLCTIKAENDLAVYFAQGYVTAKYRLWQLELTRRIASGTLSELFGKKTLEIDQFQRKLQLKKLAQRDHQQEQDQQQLKILTAYVEGINYYIDAHYLLPIELLILKYRPAKFEVLDTYLIAHLKYFINATWKAKILFTKLTKYLPKDVYQILFSQVDANAEQSKPDIGTIDWLYQQSSQVMTGMNLLGVDSSDVGSNCIVIHTDKCSNGSSYLACDPHMGHVSPAFNMMFKLQSKIGLNVFGANMPGAPGIIIGRNQSFSWGMVGIMANNQDLFIAKFTDDGKGIKGHLDDENLHTQKDKIIVKGSDNQPIDLKQGGCGRLLFKTKTHGAFFYWPGLDQSVGDISFRRLNNANSLNTFRGALKYYKLSPMTVCYADKKNIASQVIGLFPKRQNYQHTHISRWDNSDHHWMGYIDFDDLPYECNPKCGYIIHSNQKDNSFNGADYLANRWHPPSRYLRIIELLNKADFIDMVVLKAIQNDHCDVFAHAFLNEYREKLDLNFFDDWCGDTSVVHNSLLFDQWFLELAKKLTKTYIDDNLLLDYYEQWPSFRWNIQYLLNSLTPQQQIQCLKDSFLQAKENVPKNIQIIYRHQFGVGFWGSLFFNRKIKYKAGNRETVNVERISADFLSSSQNTQQGKKGFIFGQSFNFIFDLSDKGEIEYLNSSSNKGSVLSVSYWLGFYRWKKRKYLQTRQNQN